MMKVLVTYASKKGSTREVAEAMAATLREDGAAVDVRPARAVKERGDEFTWDRVIVGGALYSGRWHRDAHRFLKRHRADLADVPVAVFGMGPREDTPESWQHARAQLDRALARRAWLAPSAVAVFGGADSPERAARLGSRRDLRDWGAIHAWARRPT
jgi:menaquinone-dependent protoporphyrinogen oxidase